MRKDCAHHLLRHRNALFLVFLKVARLGLTEGLYSGTLALMMRKMTHLHSLYQNGRGRHRALHAAAAGLAEAERIPFAVLLFLLLGLPLFLQPTLYTELSAMLWWARIWTPVWVLVTVMLYAIFYLPHVPAQIVGASVDAMEQADPEVEFVRFHERVEEICLQAFIPTIPTAILRQKTTVHARIHGDRAWQDRYRRRRLRLHELGFPAPRLIPLLSSSRDSSD